MRAIVFFAGNNDGVKLSFTRLTLKKALESINKKSVGNEFTIIDSIVVKKPKVVRDFIANRISSNKIVNTDLYYISDIEIKEIISYTRDFFSIKITKNLNEEYETTSEMKSASVETTSEQKSPSDETTSEMKSSSDETTSEQKSPSDETTSEQKSPSDETTSEYIPSSDETTSEYIPSSVETTSEIKSSSVETKASYEPKSKYFLVKEYFIIYSTAFIIYSTAFIIYSIYQYTKSNNCLSN